MPSARQGGYKWERVFQKSFDKCFPEGFIYKLIDTHSLEGITKAAMKQNKAWGKMVVPRVPADYICIHKGQTIWAECKNTVNKTSFPLRNIKDHQIEFATLIENAGGRYYFAIRREIPRNHQCYLITVDDIIRLKKENQNRKSIKWEQLENDPHVKKPPFMKGAKFDISCMFD
jgi:recombination protein U